MILPGHGTVPPTVTAEADPRAVPNGNSFAIVKALSGITPIARLRKSNHGEDSKTSSKGHALNVVATCVADISAKIIALRAMQLITS